ncbi:MAG: LytTR family DNA-binding domain-containing protein [Flavobacteriaceae bacterium]|nr:LytTR family DNA-binding domain-containing protein [Flavobacteriaceae bacterium]
MIRALIIDDEEDARESLRLTLENYCPEVAVIASCESPTKGIEKIKEIRPDVVFLDIQMPQLSGFDLLQRIDQIDFEVIFVTAYDRYAIKAIKFSALDYLLKPIDVDDLISAVQRLKSKQKTTSVHYHSLFSNLKFNQHKITRIAIPVENEIVIQKTDEILYLQADGNYTQLYRTNNKPLLVSKTLKDFETLLQEADFFRVHHSTLVNPAHIKKYVKGEGGYIVVSNGDHINVSRRKKEAFLQFLKKM